MRMRGSRFWAARWHLRDSMLLPLLCLVRLPLQLRRCRQTAGIDHGAAFEDAAPELDVSDFCIVVDGHERFGQAGVSPMATYLMVYGDEEQVVRETYEDIDEVEREDGWVVLFRGPEAILRVQESHVQSMELLDS
jgi:hypothetical protein